MSAILLILAVVLFLLAAFGMAALGPLGTTALGLACFAGAGLVGPVLSWTGAEGPIH